MDTPIVAQNPSKHSSSRPKRFFKQQIPDSILNNPSLKSAMSLLPQNYNLEVPKCIWRIKQANAKRIALQFPEGLLMYSLILSDIFESFADIEHCFVLGDVTYGACCVDDFSAKALGADFLIHYGHSCLVPIDHTLIPCLYVFVDIQIDVEHLVETIRANFTADSKLALAGTIQFSTAIHTAKSIILNEFAGIVVPQSKPLSAGEILGCTSPSLPKGAVDAVVFIADGRFHLEAFMIANPGVRAFRYDPYLKVLFLEEYDHRGMKEARKNAVLRAGSAQSWAIVLGTLGRQGNPRILDHLQQRMSEKGFSWVVVLMSEISPAKVALFEDSIDAWIQIACPRLSIDWGESFKKPLLTPFEAEIALGFVRPWWEKQQSKIENSKSFVCNEMGDNGLDCGKASCCNSTTVSNAQETEDPTDYPMDYYAQDGGPWNSSYAKKSPQERRPRPLTDHCRMHISWSGMCATKPRSLAPTLSPQASTQGGIW